MTIALGKSFQLIYSNTRLDSHETVPFMCVYSLCTEQYILTFHKTFFPLNRKATSIQTCLAVETRPHYTNLSIPLGTART